MDEYPPRISTSTFFSLLFKASNLEQFIKKNAEEMKFQSFSEYITEFNALLDIKFSGGQEIRRVIRFCNLLSGSRLMLTQRKNF